jgi:pimeloyl-ACP methyl ester carboxylesterase
MPPAPRTAWLSILALMAVAACGTTTPREAVVPLHLNPCSVAQSTTEARCGTYPVFEDRVARSGRTIPLKVLVLPALTENPAPDPVFVLAGGPGHGAASQVTRGVVDFFGPMRTQRDIVFVDQRGTGESHRLQCRIVADSPGARRGFGDMLPPDLIRACREVLEPIADLRLYTTSIAMDDLDQVRAALGYELINLYGVSYGSLAAQQYLRQHPARVRSLTLAGVATPAQKLPLHFAAGAQAALDHLTADCAADEACRRAFPDLTRDIATVFAQFDTGPVALDLPAAAGQGAERVRMSRAIFAERLRLMLYNLRSASRVPLVLHRAAQKDWTPFVRATSPSLTGTSASVAMGMYLTITCSESIAVISEHDIVTRSRNSFVGEDRTRIHVRACQEWPRGAIAPSFYEPVRSRVPVLMLSGELDAATPAHWATTAAGWLPNSRQIFIRNAAHEYFAPCLRDLAAEFVAKGSTRDLDTRCVETLRRPAFVTR